ncbi:MAG: DUF2807 domain-containing protein [Eudoraea sp.]|nr:DUF2807 domain-containing protein [Eudoraea sp.]
MKNLLLVVMVLSLGLIHAQRKPKIKGNKNVIEVLETLPAFHTIELKDDLEIHIDNASSESYSIVGDDNLIDVLRFRVVDSTLIISSFYKITAKKQLDITVNYMHLKSIIVREGSLIGNQRILTDELSIMASGVARVDLAADSPLAQISLEENSRANLNIQVDSLNLALKDKASIQLYASTTQHTVKMEGNTVATLEGNSDTLNINLKESANLKAQKLEAAAIRLETGETAVARIYGYRDLELLATGAARTYLYGNPKIIITAFEDSAELHKESE